VLTESKPVDNEKFRFRIFCISLGMVGPEFAQARRALGKRLDGNSAWANGIDPRAKAPVAPPQEATVVPKPAKKAQPKKKPAAPKATPAAESAQEVVPEK
jgi:outer membrane biosynthesis protein TonB